MVRGFVVWAGLLAGFFAALPAVAGEMTAADARRFVVGKLFAYSCFEGTRGSGRVHADGSAAGTVQLQGDGPVRHAALPAGTLRVKGNSVCASVRGMMFEPCFNLEQTGTHSFRGTVYGLGFAYCDFTRRGARVNLAGTSRRPLSLQASATSR